MGLKETIQSILTQLRTVTVTNQDGSSVALYAAVFNDQINREAQGEGVLYPKPACFVETIMGIGLPIGHGATAYDVVFKFHAVIEDYNTEGMFDEGLPIFDLRDKIHRKLNQFQPTNCSHLFQGATDMDYSHNNTIVCVLEYPSHFIDMVGSITDTELYTTETIENPILQLQETPYIGVMPEEPTDPTGEVTGSILYVPGSGLHQWYTGTGAPADSVGSNGDYYRNAVNGDIYYKELSAWSVVGSIVGGGGGGMTGFENVNMTDADYKANTGDCIFIAEGTFTTARVIDLSELVNEGDEIWVINREKIWGLSYSEQNVYGAYGDVLNQVYFNTNTYIRMIGGKLRIMIGG